MAPRVIVTHMVLVDGLRGKHIGCMRTSRIWRKFNHTRDWGKVTCRVCLKMRATVEKGLYP